jgi:hypothetical protein
MFYDPKKKIIVNYGVNRPCGINNNKFSIHAEQKAIQFCKKYDKRNRYIILISRFDKKGNHKPTMCCNACSKLAKKYNFTDRIYTVNKNNDVISAITDNPQISLAYRIKHDL